MVGAGKNLLLKLTSPKYSLNLYCVAGLGKMRMASTFGEELDAVAVHQMAQEYEVARSKNTLLSMH